MKRRLAAAAVAVLGLALVVPHRSAEAGPSSGSPEPTAAARRAGVEAGNAPMGWSQEPEARPAAKLRAAAMTGVLGIDVASYQGNVNWAAYKKQGKVFAFVKATEGTSYKNPYYPQQFGGSATAGFIRGAYHFANPGGAPGRAQADYFVTNGGMWVKDGRTLPGVLDIEHNPYGAMCYGVSKPAMVSWISAFVKRYKERTGRDAVIYTTASWWATCTGNSTAFRTTNPLWVARWASTPGTLPGGWPYYTFWQYSSSPIDQDKFSGSYARLQVLANG